MTADVLALLTNPAIQKNIDQVQPFLEMLLPVVLPTATAGEVKELIDWSQQGPLLIHKITTKQ